MTSSLVGSEMCIRDSGYHQRATIAALGNQNMQKFIVSDPVEPRATVSYTHLTLPTICSV
eukprot:3039590-Prorocentrum_lima.AAC.1